MSDVPPRKIFTTVESTFLEAGDEMDRAAEAAGAQAQAEVEGEGEAPSRSVWARFVTLALGRWGVVGLVGLGTFVVGGASFRFRGDAANSSPALVIETAVEVAPPRSALLPIGADAIAREIARPSLGAARPTVDDSVANESVAPPRRAVKASARARHRGARHR